MSASSPEQPTPEQIAERVAAAGGRARFAGRVAVGIYGDSAAPPWKLATAGGARGQVWAMGALAACEAAPLAALLLLLPEAAEASGVAPTTIGLAVAASLVVLLLVTGPVAAVATGPRRRALAIGAGLNLAVVGIFLGQLLSPVALFALLAVRAVLLALSYGTNRPLLTDVVVPEARVRALARLRVGTAVGMAIGAAGASLVFLGPQLSVGQVISGTSFVALLLGLLAFGLREPGYGGAEAQRMGLVFGVEGSAHFRHRPRSGQSLQRVVTLPAARATLTGYVGVGFVVTGMLLPAFTMTKVRGAEPGIALAAMAAALLVVCPAVLFVGWQTERMRRLSPDRGAWVAFLGLLIGAVGVAGLGTFQPGAALPTAFALCIVGGLIAAVALDAVLMSVLAPGDRAAAALLSGLSTAAGAFLGFLLANGMLNRTDPGPAFLVTAVPVLLFALACRRLVGMVTPAIDELVGAQAEDAVLHELVEDENAEVPVLSAQRVSFSYGSVQALFDVSLRVQPGELVALLGPNGVGKTTLLRVLAGLGKPSAGAVRIEGRDVTSSNASQRVLLGLSEIVGGNAVFGTMTVAENLRMYGYSLGRDTAAINAGIEQAYGAFPKLADRRSQLASTLSGGEQQMLGLSKALILKPKVLLIDEFSLGLAPVIVGDLMNIVRRLNAAGTAVLLVEQSVNVALALCSRVYFMEKGRITFEGDSESLRADPELVKALSLGGAHAADLAGAHP